MQLAELKIMLDNVKSGIDFVENWIDEVDTTIVSSILKQRKRIKRWKWFKTTDTEDIQWRPNTQIICFSWRSEQNELNWWCHSQV